jgi:hypothetical protein
MKNSIHANETAPHITVPQCITCAHWIRGQRCAAFFDDIPIEITTGKFNHSKPHPKDNGLRYSKKG